MLHTIQASVFLQIYILPFYIAPKVAKDTNKNYHFKIRSNRKQKMKSGEITGKNNSL